MADEITQLEIGDCIGSDHHLDVDEKRRMDKERRKEIE